VNGIFVCRPWQWTSRERRREVEVRGDGGSDIRPRGMVENHNFWWAIDPEINCKTFRGAVVYVSTLSVTSQSLQSVGEQQNRGQAVGSLDTLTLLIYSLVNHDTSPHQSFRKANANSRVCTAGGDSQIYSQGWTFHRHSYNISVTWQHPIESCTLTTLLVYCLLATRLQ
jgi:hypothetical protein